MAAITVQDVVNVAPELSAYAQTTAGAAAIERSIAVAEIDVSQDTWGRKYTRGLALYAAHLTLVDTPSLGGLVLGGGVVQSQTVGSASETYASAGVVRAEGTHSNTRPGLLYDREIQTLEPGIFYV